MNVRLINAEISSQYVSPGEELSIKCGFEALEDIPISTKLKIFVDLEIGYQRIDPDKQGSYRYEDNIYPQPFAYRKGETYYHSIRIKISETIWGGSYSVKIGFCNDNKQQVEFLVKDKTIIRAEIGEIEVAFSGIATKFVQDHRKTIYADFGSVNGDGIDIAEKKTGLVRIRRKSDDSIAEKTIIFAENMTYDLSEVSFKLCASDEKYYVSNVQEQDGFELLNIEFPNLFFALNQSLITLIGGGQIVDSASTAPYGFERKYFVRNLGILTDGNSSMIVETPYLDDLIHFSICEISGKKYASIGVTFTWRVRASGDLESIMVINQPTVTFKTIDGDFVACLPYMRKDLSRATERFKDTILYYYTIEAPGYRDTQTFDEAKEYARKMYNLTGGVRQHMILRGWQHEGHDTGYPNVFMTCKKSGTFDDARRVAEEAFENYNATLVFHDNYDDLYENNGYFDKRIAALDYKGNYYKAWIWNSGVSIISGFKKSYQLGIMQERVKQTVDVLNLYNKKHHIDVLTQEIRRYDFDPKIKAAAEETMQYKKKVIEEYKKYGIVLSSEGISHPFANSISMYWRLVPRQQKIFSEERFFPLFAMIYHGYCYYTDAGEGNSEIVNAAQITPLGRGYYCCNNLEEYKRAYWLKVYPMLSVRDATYDEYYCDGSVHMLRFSNGGKIVYDEKKDLITVSVGENIISQNGNTFGPGYKSGEYVGYTEKGHISVRFDKKIKCIFELETTGKKTPIHYSHENGYLTMDIAPNTGFKVVLD